MIREDWSTLRKLTFMSMIAGGKSVEDTATGNPVTFLTDLAKPLKSLLVPFTPVQEGTGDPSPQNVRSILPWNGLKVWQNGRDVPISWDVNGDGKYIGVNGNIGESTNFHYSDLIAVTQGLYRYSFSTSSDSNRSTRIHGYNSSGEWVEQLAFEPTTNGTYIIDFAVPVGISYIRISNTKLTTDESVINVTETDISFPSPVYGGILDVVSGVLTVEYAEVILKGTEEWFESENKFFVTSVSALKNNTAKQNIFCDLFKYSLNGADYLLQGQFTDSISSAHNIRIRKHDDEMTLQEFRTMLASNNMHIVYKLETPQEITLTPEQITALKGDNTIWSDADGSMTAVYLKKG